MLSCIGSTLLQLSFHFQNILISWSTNPFYASRIAIYYGIVIFCYFLGFKFAYSIPISLMRHNFKRNAKHHINMCEIRVIATSYIITLFVLTVPMATVSIFIVFIPINYSAEESVSGVTTIYKGAVILIGALIAYRVGSYWLYNRDKKSKEKQNKNE